MFNVSTRKTIRTVIQTVVGLAGALAVCVPLFDVSFPTFTKYGAVILGAVAVVTKIQTALEQSGVIGKVADPAKAPDAVPVTPTVDTPQATY